MSSLCVCQVACLYSPVNMFVSVRPPCFCVQFLLSDLLVIFPGGPSAPLLPSPDSLYQRPKNYLDFTLTNILTVHPNVQNMNIRCFENKINSCTVWIVLLSILSSAVWIVKRMQIPVLGDKLSRISGFTFSSASVSPYEHTDCFIVECSIANLV